MQKVRGALAMRGHGRIAAAAARRSTVDAARGEIEDRPDNTTRFLVSGRKCSAASGDDRTTAYVGNRDPMPALSRL